jgi:hypothetical protein
MHRLATITYLVMVPFLLGGPAIAQDAARQSPAQIDGRSLAEPEDQRQADEAMHTESGKAGRTEPGAHAPLQGTRPPLKGGKLNVPQAPTTGQSTPPGQ